MNLLYVNDRKGEYPPSLYAGTRDPLAPFSALQGEARADVAIVGGGYTGLSAALHLAQAGLSVTLLEAHRVGFGASGRNGGQVGSGQRLEVDDLERMAGPDTARQLWDLAEDAKVLVRDIAARSGVPLHDGVAHAFATAREFDHARRNIDRLARNYGYDRITALGQQDFRAILPSDRYVGGELDMGAGHLHPLNLAIGMARLARDAGATIHENSAVLRIHHAQTAGGLSVLTTDSGVLRCNHVILAANAYLDRLDGKVAARVMPINNYIVATEPLGDRVTQVLTRDIAVHDTKFVVNYWRLSPDQRLIFGGGETLSYRFPTDIAAKVRKPLLQIYPGLADVALTHAWGGSLAITRTRMPCVMRPAPNCLSISGYSGHGVALATLAERIMARAVTGQAGEFDVMARLTPPPFPGGALLRQPLLVAGMTWFALRDRLGF
ncbi:FAD-binding oxidoreductase [Paracoccus sp. DMF-8]|uniref:NAD(P)/FAD-dependent oxidoreductase n=1 Tax=Paracoccus sp. DMF-8 TaxID=3019445 RepID=UPI0023E7969F|nr:FAD-binding oxidoreductase [Paracoccus sp. DMF-8]MDF3605447.1 FAD-binding oxidoreductase [Paracoccus sp. DMF-8]